MPITKYASEHADELRIIPERLDHLDFMLHKWIREDAKPAIVVEVKKDGRTIFEGAYGSSGKENVPLVKDAIFPVSSITKPVISMLLLMLQEDGLVNLNDPVTRYLDHFIGEGGQKVAIWHLLTHTSGIFEEDLHQFAAQYIKENYGLEMNNEMTYEEMDRIFYQVYQKMGFPPTEDLNHASETVWDRICMMMPLPREPRTAMSYCSFGYEKAKEIITTVTGETIDEFASRKLFRPLGMTDSHFVLPKEKWGRVIGRVGADCKGVEWLTSPECFVNESGAGGLKTTASDMVRFMEMIRLDGTVDGHRYLSKASTGLMKLNQNIGVGTEWDSWTMGFNYRGIKVDDTGMLRSEGAIDHGGYGGTKVLLEPVYNLSYAFFGVEYQNRGFGFHGRFFNILISAMG